MAQLVNVIGPIMAEPGLPAWRQTSFFPFRDASSTAGGTALRVAVDAPPTEAGVPSIAAAAVSNADGTVQLMVVNRQTAGTCSVEIDLSGFGELGTAEGTVLHDADPFASNTAEHPRRVQPRALAVDILDSIVMLELPAVSWSVITINTQQP
jgi:alpha-N-arabinofuranosidase